MICMLAFRLGDAQQWMEDWLEQILGHMRDMIEWVYLLDVTFNSPEYPRNIQHFTGHHIRRNAARQTYDTIKIKKYRKSLARMKHRILVGTSDCVQLQTRQRSSSSR